jgi:hypothetical protein
MSRKYRICFVSIDVEEDLRKEDIKTFEGIKKLNKILDIFKKYKIKSTLFVTGDVLQKFPGLVVNWSKNHEIACHGFHHIPLNELSPLERKKQLKDFIQIYEDLLSKKPKGFRAVQHTIDDTQIKLLVDSGFRYDSSVIPRYIFFKSYIGYKGKAPNLPYLPCSNDYRKKGDSKILELPVSPLIFNFPLGGTWIRTLGPNFYKFLLFFKKPEYISLAIHPWDAICHNGKYSKNSGEIFLEFLDEILEYLNKFYLFKSGEDFLQDPMNKE